MSALTDDNNKFFRVKLRADVNSNSIRMIFPERVSINYTRSYAKKSSQREIVHNIQSRSAL
ncbi:hypothetical protein CSA37_00530 [Candidatus Fermentibacteria bacterium]|nr:MAG: hypothetical protein CSA37_09760 [Candidatus Fermentibacteria bacterium]PIE53685.1 MAG: hypothetical protein CSA37_00530 [Candidatus Fermentibacteria bacterium]